MQRYSVEPTTKDIDSYYLGENIKNNYWIQV